MNGRQTLEIWADANNHILAPCGCIWCYLDGLGEEGWMVSDGYNHQHWSRRGDVWWGFIDTPIGEYKMIAFLPDPNALIGKLADQWAGSFVAVKAAIRMANTWPDASSPIELRSRLLSLGLTGIPEIGDPTLFTLADQIGLRYEREMHKT